MRLAGLTTASLGALAACGAPGLGSSASQPASSVTAGSGAGASSGSPAASAFTNPSQPVTLRLASWQWVDPAYAPFWEQTTQAFSQKYPSVKFEKYSYPIDQLFDKLNTDIAAGSPPDLLELTGFNIFEYASRNVLEPLDSYWQGTDIPNIVKDQKTYPVWQGKQYALNLSARTLQLFANTRLFDAKNVKLPTTLDEFTAACKDLTDSAKQQFGFVTVNVPASRFYEMLLLFTAGLGGHFSKNGKPALNDPKVVQALTYLKSLFDAGYMPKGVKDNNAQYGFYDQQKAAMSIDGAWFIAVLRKDGQAALKSTKILSIPTKTHATTGGVNNVIGISRTSKSKAVAAEYLRFITDVKWARLWTEKSLTFSTVKGAVTPAFLKANPLFEVFNKDLDKAVQLPPPGLETQYNAIQKIVDNNAVKALYDNKSPKDVLDEAQKQAEALVKK
ncbi:MAG: ABC transporter substrate-binding protein [Chloroflexota bacterium]